MRFLFAAGGTGGHVIPALVVARELVARHPGAKVQFVGTPKGVENRLVPQAGFDLALITVGAWQGQAVAKRLTNLLGAPRAWWQAQQILRKFQPNLVLGVGGYAAGPIMLAAGIGGVPLAVLEPNAFPGMANRWVAPYVGRAFLAFQETSSYFRPGTALVTGIPTRPEFFQVTPHRHSSPFTVLIFGGSQGARSLNRAAVEALPQLESWGKDLRIVHQTGQSEYNAVREAYERSQVPAEVLPYIENMPERFAEADLVVCRAGANTIAELAAAGKPAILIPFPAAANQHQLRNAEALVRIGAARLIADRELNGETLVHAISELRNDPARMVQMSRRIGTMARPDATQIIADELERLAGLGV
ncbi:MAG: undecaprenyldiphospho-muramoylpentapeptide beta-N-acetylglucosaminyltransferase [Acidobacteria bacterium]|nr:undecaprenyldiphospho-muramoylpentapeptide beta-N-acetylglucosaminyltransferase [Acidobacteriota bacterium]